MKDQTACFTGHRYQALSCLNLTDEEIDVRMYHLAQHAIRHLHEKYGITRFISGMAIGFDQAAAEAVLDYKISYPEIELISARPFPSQHIKWPQHLRDRYFKILGEADDIVDVNSDPYAAWKMHARNAWMVDNSSVLIEFLLPDVTIGGTFSCHTYAVRKGLAIYNINPITQESTFTRNSPE